MTQVTFPILILAAGASTRMRGADKLMADISGIPLLRQQVLRAQAATDGPVLVALPAPPHARYTALEGLDATLVPVIDAAQGMGRSIAAGIAALPQGCQAVLIVLADLPDLQANDFRTVLEAVDLTSDTLIWRGTSEDGQPGHPIVFRAALFPQLQALQGDDGGRSVVQRAKGAVSLVRLPGRHATLDLDTPEDWARWRLGRDDRPG